MPAVDIKRPLKVSKEPSEITTVKNVGAPTVYYKAGQAAESVSSSLNDGSLANGKKLVLNQTTCFIATEAGAQVEILERGETIREPEEDIRIISEAPKNPFNYGAVGDGSTDDGKALNECFAAAREQSVIIPPSAGFVTTEALKIPVSTRVFGVNRRTCSILAKGEISLLDVTAGDVQIENLFLRCETPQTAKGAAIDLVHGFTTNLQASNLRIGSNFFNGFNLVGSSAAAGIYIKDILFEEFSGAVKSFGNAAFVVGDKAKRTTIVQLSNITGVANKPSDMPVWIKVANTDSLFATNCGFQNGLEGVTVGVGDNSSQGTTNLSLEGVWLDGGVEGMGVGYRLSNLFAGDLRGCHAQGCSPGVYVLGDVICSVTGGKYYHNYGSGFWFDASCKEKSSFQITGATIADNNEAKGAAAKEECGVFLEKKAGGVQIVGNTISNSEHFGGGFQKFGVYVEGENKNYQVVGNRIFGNLTKNVEDKGEASKTVANNLET